MTQTKTNIQTRPTRPNDFEFLSLTEHGNLLTCSNTECRDPEARFFVGVSANTLTLICSSCSSKQLVIVNREIYVDKANL